MICNRLKGTNIASVDSVGEIVRLFRPGTDQWHDHFLIEGSILQPLTSVAEATAKLLRFNSAERVIERSLLQRLGRYPRGWGEPCESGV
jgi:hypothetical protein